MKISTYKSRGMHKELNSPYLNVSNHGLEVGSLLHSAAMYDAMESETAKAHFLEQFYKVASTVKGSDDIEKLKSIIDDMMEKGGIINEIGPELKAAVNMDDRAYNELLSRTNGRLRKNNFKSIQEKRDVPVSTPQMDDNGNIIGFDTQYHIDYPPTENENDYMQTAVEQLLDQIIKYDATRADEDEKAVEEFFIMASDKAQTEEDYQYLEDTLGQLRHQGGIAYSLIDRYEYLFNADVIERYKEDTEHTTLAQEEKDDINKVNYDEFMSNYEDAITSYNLLDKLTVPTEDELNDIIYQFQAAHASLETLRELFTEEEFKQYEEEILGKQAELESYLELDNSLGKAI